MTATMERRESLPSLTSLRAVAALIVFAHHLSSALFPWGINAYGYVGVTFFYVLSGFVLTWSATSNGGLGRFYARRFFRIYPSHFVITLILLSIPTILVNHKSAEIDLTQVFLIQAWSPKMTTVWGLNGVTWSLSCEFFFYLLFPSIIRGTSRLSTTAFLCITGVLLAIEGGFTVYASHLTEYGPISMIAGANPVVRLPEFVLGIAVARFAMAGRRLHWLAGSSVAVICISGLVLAPARPAPDVWFAPLMGLVILFFARPDAAGARLLGWRPFVYAGEISFAFYLVHQLVVNYIAPRLGLGSGWLEAAAALALAVVVAVALHHLVEKPAFRFFVGRADTAMARRRAALTAAIA